MKSQGTHDTQGINGDAIALQRRLDVIDLSKWSTGQACGYDDHRPTDWRLRAGGPVVCGICHPAPPALDIVLVIS